MGADEQYVWRMRTSRLGRARIEMMSENDRLRMLANYDKLAAANWAPHAVHLELCEWVPDAPDILTIEWVVELPPDHPAWAEAAAAEAARWT